MAVKSLHQFFYYHNKYLNSMKCREISMGPSIHIIQCKTSVGPALWKGIKDNNDSKILVEPLEPRLHVSLK
jgi:hypothetical protein